MDQMIYHLNKLMGKNPLTDEQARLCVAYLNGKASLEGIKLLLPKSDRGYYYVTREADEIAEGIAANTSLLPRLGLYLKLLRCIGTSASNNLITRLLNNNLNEEQVFLESGFGEEELLAFLFNGKLQSDYHKKLISKIYENNSAVYLRFVEDEARIEPIAWLCAQNGWELSFSEKKQGVIGRIFNRDDSKKYSGLLTEYVAALLVSIHSEGRTLDALYKAAETEMPEATDILKKADNNLLKSLAVKNDARFRPSSVLTRALLLTDYKLESLNRIMKISFRAASVSFIDDLTNIFWLRSETLRNLYQYRDNKNTEYIRETIEKQIKPLRAVTDKLGVDSAYYCAWLVQQLVYFPKWYSEPFENEFANDTETLRRCVKIAPAMLKAYLCRMLEKRGDTFPEEIACECADILYNHSEKDLPTVKNLVNWLKSGEGECPTESINHFSRLNHHASHSCDIDWAIACLVGFSPVAKRYYEYLVNIGKGERILFAADFAPETLDISAEALASFILEAAPAANAIAAIAESAGSLSTAQQRFMKALIISEPDSTAAIIGGKASVGARVLLLELLYEAIPEYDSDFLIGCLGDKSKKISGYAMSLLLPQKALSEQIRPLLDAKKQALRDYAQTLMAAYEDSGATAETGDILGFATRSMPRNPAQAVKWVFPSGEFPQVRWADRDEPADEVVSKCYLAAMLSSKTVDLPPVAAKIRPHLNENDLHEIAVGVYSSWIADGAAAKFRAALLIYGVHATDSDVLTLQKQINDWAEHSRGAIAADAVRAMAMGGNDLALLTVDSMSRKFKNKQVRRAAGEALDAAAAAIGISTEELGDRIIPSLGFDERGERVIDYGTRTFTAAISPALAIELTDESGKKIKSLPKPGAKDDTEKAERAKSDFTALKKSLKAVVQTQQQRLEQALATGRTWTPEAWQKLFVQNPIMHSFATGLVWGVYSEGKLGTSFRYMEDGSFTDINEDDFELPAVGGNIGLVHPLDLDEASAATWKQQLEDYEITQPITQLERPVYLILEDEKNTKTLDRFGGLEMLAITLSNKLQKSGWYRGSVQDAGCFYTFYREIGDIGIEITFSGCYVSPDPTEAITVGQVVFYKAGSIKRGSYVYDEVKKEDAFKLGDISARLFSEMVYDVTNATLTSTGKNERWIKEPGLLYFGGK